MSRRQVTEEYQPSWEIDNGLDSREKFRKENRKTKAEIMAEIENEKLNAEQNLIQSEKNQEEFELPDLVSSHPGIESQEDDQFEYKSLIETQQEIDEAIASLMINHQSNEPEIERRKKTARMKKGRNFNPDHPEDWEIEEEESGMPLWIRILISLVCMALVSGGMVLFGYWQSDISNQEEAYLIPLEIRYERSYVAASDQLMDFLLRIDQTIQDDLMTLPENAVEKGAVLSAIQKDLQNQVNAVSRYVGVPVKFEPYQKQLINFSLSLSKMLSSAMESYAKDGYSDYILSALNDYQNEFESLKRSRLQIEQEIFRNMDDLAGSADYKQDTLQEEE